MMRRLVGAALLCALVPLGACGGDDDDTDGAGDGTAATGDALELAARLPEDARTIGVVDLDAARDQLGLPPGTGVDDIDFGDEPDRVRLLSIAALGLPFLARPQDVPLSSALDVGQVHAAAAVGEFASEYGAAVVRTDQDYADLAEALVDEGYDEAGDLLVSELPAAAITYPVVADGGDGTVVLAQSETAARAVLDGGGGPSALTELLDRLPGIGATATAAPDAEGCGSRVGVGIDLEPAAGELVVFAGDEPDPDAAIPDPDANPIVASLEVDDREIDGDYVRVSFEYEPDPPLSNPSQLVFGDLLVSDIYEC